jgi:LPS export ABC transporter protein LptC
MRPRRLGPALAAILAVSIACADEQAPQTVGLELLEQGADQVMVSVHHFMTREGVRRAALRADTAYIMDDEATIELRRVHLIFYDEEGGEESVLTAAAGTYHMQSGDMSATGSVVVEQADGSQRLETEQLAYDAAADRLRGEEPFVFTQGTRVTRGESFESDPSLENRKVDHISVVADVEDQ